jgi:hypothetical protein
MCTVLTLHTLVTFSPAPAGLSLALGAFLAGLLIAETEYALQVESDIMPFKGLLMGLFFMTVGGWHTPGVAAPALVGRRDTSLAAVPDASAPVQVAASAQSQVDVSVHCCHSPQRPAVCVCTRQGRPPHVTCIA